MMEQWFTLLMDLPDEIIMLILSKLDNADVLYSLMDVNDRLDRILHDEMFTTKIALAQTLSSEKKLDEKILDRFCLEILPKIPHHIQWLSVDASSMERIFLAADYPNLNQLDIFIIDNELPSGLTDESSVVRTFQNQIVTLSVDGNISYNKGPIMFQRALLFSQILNMFTNVRHLNFYQSNYSTNGHIRFTDTTSNFCSNLVELHIYVRHFDDCLYLLDGRLPQLRRFFVTIHLIFPIESVNSNRKQLSQLKQFSLISINETFVYDEVIVPHLRSMTNLESLTLFLAVENQDQFIDGSNFTRNILSHMPHLNQFLFNIRSIVSFDNQLQFPSNDKIQRSFKNCTDYQVVSYVDYFPSNKRGQCCVYTYPYTMLHFDGITNSFPGGSFKYVRYVRLVDERPFEHTFFLSIAQAFPSLEQLDMKNFEAQKCKDDQDNNNNNGHLPSIKYPHLTALELMDVHDDYAEQFLLHTRTCFSNPIHLVIGYDTIQRVTYNFTRDATRVNCGKIKWLCIPRRSPLPKHFNLYFPHVE